MSRCCASLTPHPRGRRSRRLLTSPAVRLRVSTVIVSLVIVRIAPKPTNTKLPTSTPKVNGRELAANFGLTAGAPTWRASERRRASLVVGFRAGCEGGMVPEIRRAFSEELERLHLDVVRLASSRSRRSTVAVRRSSPSTSARSTTASPTTASSIGRATHRRAHLSVARHTGTSRIRPARHGHDAPGRPRARAHRRLHGRRRQGDPPVAARTARAPDTRDPRPDARQARRNSRSRSTRSHSETPRRDPICRPWTT